MEFSKKIKILSALVIVLTATLVSGIVFSSASINKRKSQERIISDDSIKAVAAITVDLENGVISLKKEGTDWFFSANDKKYPAAKDKIDNFLDSVSKITKYQLSGSDKKSWNKFDLEDDKSKNAFFYDVNGNMLFSLHIGKDGPVKGGGEYIRTSFSEEVFLIDASISRYFLRNNDYWSNLRILPQDVDSNVISSVKVRSEIKLDEAVLKINFHIKKETSGNSFEWKNMVVDKSVDRNKADMLITNIVSISGDSFSDFVMKEKDAEIEIETDNHGRIIIDAKIISEEDMIIGVRGSDLKYRTSTYKIERIMNSINNIYAETN